MALSIYIPQQQRQDLLQINSFFHRGVGFFWEQEGVIHVFTHYPEIAPSGKPILTLFKKLSSEDSFVDCESLLQQIDSDLSVEQNMPINNFACVFFHAKDAIGYLKIDGEFIKATITTTLQEQNAQSKPFRNKKVLVIGLDAIGLQVCKGLAMGGVENFSLIDIGKFDTPGYTINCGYQNVGRFKVWAATDEILKHNPAAKIDRFVIDTEEESEILEQECQNANIIIYLDDHTVGRISINILALAFRKSIIFGRVDQTGESIEIFHFRGHDSNAPCIACAMSTSEAFQESSIENDQLQATTDLWIENMTAASYISGLAINQLQAVSDHVDKARDYAFWSMKDNQSLRSRLPLWSQMYPDDNSPKTLRWLGFLVPKLADCPICGIS